MWKYAILLCITVSAGLSACVPVAKHRPLSSPTPQRSPAENASASASSNQLSFWNPLAERQPSHTWPAAAEDCAIIYDPVNRRLVLFGGKDDADTNRAETWAFSLTEGHWQNLTAGQQPPPCEDHTAIYDPLGHRMLLYGGENGPTSNALWSLDLNTHHWRNLTDSTAPFREDHTAVYDSRGRRMIVFGGRDHERYNLAEVWAFDLDPASPTFEKWSNLTVPQKHQPGRVDHVAVFDSLKNRMVIFGGWNKEEKEYLGDTWSFSFADHRWRKIKTKHAHPPKRRHAVMVFDARHNWALLCGGFGEEGYLNDVWAFDLSGDVWVNLTPGPQPRIDHQAVFDPVTGRLLLYGGDARLSTKFHDLWELRLAPQISPEVWQEAGQR
ncbi:MAG: hypothetical protein ONB48_06660 [candidate division KSB1 bacterium]|nr:hypothetical protein [candidate division KSB1 bacterium]MDZ7273222.1 hypothetical protein [candidate division KSB1 bacterium]MDZ7285324.1 hypothetical protein [candidate division KSB1 bacterium]MDZ7298356.1 hypothetical protein [candidate division KSB1 bacterium]MDZ7308520.1 hypothetical protein [candidate division KSB1 bacterium]